MKILILSMTARQSLTCEPPPPSSPVSDLVERLRTDSKGTGSFIAIVPLHALRHEAADRLTALEAENAQLRDRVKELEKALEPFDGALDDEGNPDEIAKPDNLTIYPCGYITYGDLRTARRVREGGKV